MAVLAATAIARPIDSLDDAANFLDHGVGLQRMGEFPSMNPGGFKGQGFSFCCFGIWSRSREETLFATSSLYMRLARRAAIPQELRNGEAYKSEKFCPALDQQYKTLRCPQTW